MRDKATEDAYIRAKWPQFEGGLRNSLWSRAWDLCTVCDDKPKVTEVRQCGVCSAFKPFGPLGVYYRFNGHTCQQLGIGEMQCVSCWNRYRPLAKRFEEADAARLLINQVKRKIREASKVNA